MLDLFLRFPSSQGLGTEAIEAYAVALGPYSVDAAKKACLRFSDPAYPRKDAHWHPSAVEVAAVARIYDSAQPTGEGDGLISYPIGALPPPGYVALGPLEGNWGYGRINMRDMSPRQKEIAMEVRKPQRLTNERRPMPKLQGMR